MKQKPNKPDPKRVAKGKPVQKRISNRKYPPRECLKTDCTIIFEPARKNQVYCCDQHRIDQNNDNTHAREEQIRVLERIYRHNEAVLKKLHLYISQKQSMSVSLGYFEIESYNHQLYTHATLNEDTGNTIYWNYEYGLEIFDRNKGTFTVHFK